MKLYAPSYYKDFSCIADKCRHSCCIGWEIDIDGDTMKRYSSLTGGVKSAIMESIDREGIPHFRLCEDDRCPHLDERGLCRIITELGEEYLCDICRNHPRFYNYTALGCEAGLGLSCEEAARIILSSDGYGTVEEIDETEENEEFEGFDIIPHREKIYSVLSDREKSLSEKKSIICKDYEVSLAIRSDSEWREVLSSLEYLDEGHREMFLSYSSESEIKEEHERVIERGIAYFVYRHLPKAKDEWEVSAVVGFSLFLATLAVSMLNAYENIPPEEVFRIVSEEIEYSEDNTDVLWEEFLY